MLYLTMFASAFLAATLVPFASEVTLAATLAAGGNLLWLVAVATLGNTLGSAVNWGLGRFIMRFRARPWFPVDAGRIERAQAWFRRFGVWTLLLAWAPIIGEPLTVIAGAMRVGIVPFLILVATGKGLRYIVIALAAAETLAR
ncbi:MAG: DedA family protein [Thiotrichales bacterium]|nr:DedA family protein [Thiotrichales bacterium]